MLYRNLLAMDAEELLRGHPVDGVVLMGGCDKTTPALLLGAWLATAIGAVGPASCVIVPVGEAVGVGVGVTGCAWALTCAVSDADIDE